MITSFKNILWLLPLLLFVSWPLWGSLLTTFLTVSDDFKLPATAANTRINTFAMDDIVFTQHNKGVQELQITVQNLHTSNDENRLHMKQVKVTAYSNQQQTLHITSISGLYDTIEQVVTLTDNVQVVTRQGYKIFSQRLYFFDKQNKVTTTDHVQIIIGTNIEIRGTGMMYDMTTGAYWIGGRVYFNKS